MLKQTKKTGVHLVVATMIAFGLAACGGGGGGGGPATSSAGTTTTSSGGSNPSGSGVVLGANWTQLDTAVVPSVPWHWVATNRDGSVIVAGEGTTSGGQIAPNLYTSINGGQSFSKLSSPNSNTWISADVSSDGNFILAAEYQGGLWLWDRTTAGTPTYRLLPSAVVATKFFESVTIAESSKYMAAVIQRQEASSTPPAPAIPGAIVYSNDGGVTWYTVPNTDQRWRAIDSTADGKTIVAASESGFYVCTNDGTNTSTAVACKLKAVTGATETGWYRVKISAKGDAVALASNNYAGGNSATGVYLSRNLGDTWTKPLPLAADFTSLAMSDDGQAIGVTYSTTGTAPTTIKGNVQLSIDGGLNFATTPLPSDDNWRSISISGDGKKAVAATGRFGAGPQTSVNGKLYTSP